MERYEPILKEYAHWSLVLSCKQYPYIGRCKAIAVKGGHRMAVEMTPEERRELFEQVLPDWHEMVKKAFAPAWMNLAIAGNTDPVLHVHFIPRYEQAVVFAGWSFVDPNPSGNHSPYERKEVPLDAMKKIEEACRQSLE